MGKKYAMVAAFWDQNATLSSS